MELMTVVAAIARDGQVVIAADRQTNYQNQAVFGARKVRRLILGNARSALLAATGSGGLLNVLTQHLKTDDAPPPDADLTTAQDWADVIASAATEVLAKTEPALLSTEQHDQTRAIDGALLLAHGGRLFYLFTHQACHVPDGVASLGSGGEVALGAMHAALAYGASPDDAAVGAVLLACRFAGYCGLGDGAGPHVMHLDEDR